MNKTAASATLLAKCILLRASSRTAATQALTNASYSLLYKLA